MKTIIYAGSEFTTGDEIADALLGYSESLGQAQTAETVEIPVLGPDGGRVTATFLVGPASQIVATAAREDGPEIEAPEVVQRLRELTASQHLVARPQEEGPVNGIAEWDGVA
jgi:hypothetical protein